MNCLLLWAVASLFAAALSAPCCGNGKCEYPVEDCNSCPSDCGVCVSCQTCGNRICDSALGETTCNCPTDCGPCCVDGVCREDKGENALNCPQDCGVALNLMVIDAATKIPLAGATVSCSTAQVTLGPGTTDANGKVGFSSAGGAVYTCWGDLFAYLPGSVIATVYPDSDPTVWIIPLTINPACVMGNVYDAVTLAPIPLSSVYCVHAGNTYTTSTHLSGPMGQFYYSPVPFGSYRCFGSHPLYFPNSNAGTVNPGDMVEIDIYLDPLPGGVIGHVWNAQGVGTIPIPGATITCTQSNGAQLPIATTDVNGFYFIANVASGGVACTATIVKFTTDYETGTVFVSQNTTINFTLGPLPGTLAVLVEDSTTNNPITGASVSCSGASPLSTSVTNSSGLVFYGTVSAGNYTCTASANGYIPNSNTAVVLIATPASLTILLTPAPKTVTVTVIDNVTLAVILTATTTLSGGHIPGTLSAAVTSAGYAAYSNVAIGSGFVAGGSAAGYQSPGSTAFGPLTISSPATVNVNVYLNPLPCTVIVTVWDITANVTVPGAFVTINTVPPMNGTSGADGTFTFNIYYNSATLASASAFRYSPGSAPIVGCTRGGTTNVTVPLPEVIQGLIAAKDSLTPGQPLIANPSIFFNGQLLTQTSPTNPDYYVVALPSLPYSANFTVVAGGFVTQPASKTFSTNGQLNVVFMTPTTFTLYVVPVEFLPDGSNNYINSTTLGNNYATLNTVPSTAVYQPNPISVTGATIEVGSTTGHAYTLNTYYNSTLVGSTFSELLYASVYTQVTPASISGPFEIEATTSLSNYAANPAPGITTFILEVPAFENTTERHLVFTLPYYLTTAWVNVRVWPVTQTTFAPSTFYQGDFCTCTLNSLLTNYPNLAGNTNLAIYEYSLTFGTVVTNITLGFDATSYDGVKSNWVQTNTGSAITPYAPGAAPTATTSFTFPTSDLTSSIFSTLPSGQKARDPAKATYIIRDFALIKLPQQKKKTATE